MSVLSFNKQHPINWAWKVDAENISCSEVAIKNALMDIAQPFYLASSGCALGAALQTTPTGDAAVLAFAQALTAEELGDPAFKKHPHPGGSAGKA